MAQNNHQNSVYHEWICTFALAVTLWVNFHSAAVAETPAPGRPAHNQPTPNLRATAPTAPVAPVQKHCEEYAHRIIDYCWSETTDQIEPIENFPNFLKEVAEKECSKTAKDTALFEWIEFLHSADENKILRDQYQFTLFLRRFRTALLLGEIWVVDQRTAVIKELEKLAKPLNDASLKKAAATYLEALKHSTGPVLMQTHYFGPAEKLEPDHLCSIVARPEYSAQLKARSKTEVVPAKNWNGRKVGGSLHNETIALWMVLYLHRYGDKRPVLERELRDWVSRGNFRLANSSSSEPAVIEALRQDPRSFLRLASALEKGLAHTPDIELLQHPYSNHHTLVPNHTKVREEAATEVAAKLTSQLMELDRFRPITSGGLDKLNAPKSAVALISDRPRMLTVALPTQCETVKEISFVPHDFQTFTSVSGVAMYTSEEPKVLPNEGAFFVRPGKTGGNLVDIVLPVDLHTFASGIEPVRVKIKCKQKPTNGDFQFTQDFRIPTASYSSLAVRERYRNQKNLHFDPTKQPEGRIEGVIFCEKLDNSQYDRCESQPTETAQKAPDPPMDFLWIQSTFPRAAYTQLYRCTKATKKFELISWVYVPDRQVKLSDLTPSGLNLRSYLPTLAALRRKKPISLLVESVNLNSPVDQVELSLNLPVDVTLVVGTNTGSLDPMFQPAALRIPTSLSLEEFSALARLAHTGNAATAVHYSIFSTDIQKPSNQDMEKLIHYLGPFVHWGVNPAISTDEDFSDYLFSAQPENAMDLALLAAELKMKDTFSAQGWLKQLLKEKSAKRPDSIVDAFLAADEKDEKHLAAAARLLTPEEKAGIHSAITHLLERDPTNLSAIAQLLAIDPDSRLAQKKLEEINSPLQTTGTQQFLSNLLTSQIAPNLEAIISRNLSDRPSYQIKNPNLARLSLEAFHKKLKSKNPPKLQDIYYPLTEWVQLGDQMSVDYAVQSLKASDEHDVNEKAIFYLVEALSQTPQGRAALSSIQAHRSKKLWRVIRTLPQLTVSMSEAAGRYLDMAVLSYLTRTKAAGEELKASTVAEIAGYLNQEPAKNQTYQLDKQFIRTVAEHPERGALLQMAPVSSYFEALRKQRKGAAPLDPTQFPAEAILLAAMDPAGGTDLFRAVVKGRKIHYVDMLPRKKLPLSADQEKKWFEVLNSINGNGKPIATLSEKISTVSYFPNAEKYLLKLVQSGEQADNVVINPLMTELLFANRYNPKWEPIRKMFFRTTSLIRLIGDMQSDSR